MKEFRAAVEAEDWDGLGDLLADDVVFCSPVAFTPYVGKPIVHALIFETFVDGVSLNGCDVITVNDEGKISALTVMVRPLSAGNALSRAMATQFPQIQAEAVAALKNA